MNEQQVRISERLIILAPTAKDGALSKRIIERAGMGCETVHTIDGLCKDIKAGAGAIMLTEESIESDSSKQLLTLLHNQPAWSDLPVLLITKGGADSPIAARALDELGNVVLLERPVRINTLVSASRAAISARRRQYQIERYLLENEQQAERLSQSNRELEQFAYVSSHDLQEPLRKISSFAQLINMKYRQQLDDEGIHYLDIISSGATRMTTLIKDLLSYARLSRSEERPVPVDLSDVLARVLNDLELTIKEKKAIVHSQPLPTVLGQAARLHHVFLNILSNALKFQKPGTTPRIEISAKEVKDGVQISIKDNGIGIDAKHSDQIFNVFHRLHARHQYAGTGIGLAITKKIVEQHQGKIWVEAAPDKGSTFSFVLPSEIKNKTTESAGKQSSSENLVAAR